MRKKLSSIIIIGFAIVTQSLSAQTWDPSKRLTWTSSSSFNPAVATDSNNHIHVVWSDETPGETEIYYKKSTDGGTSWATKRLTWNPGPSRSPSIAIDTNNHIHLAWVDNSSGAYEIYYKKSTDGGARWTTKRLTWSYPGSWDPAIAVDPNNHIHVVWYDNNSGDTDIFYKRSTDGGASWITKRLTWNSGSWHPAITTDSNSHIHVVWEDSTPGNDEIYYDKSTDGGASWITKRLTLNSGSSRHPSISAGSNNHIHVVWEDSTPGNDEIYYDKSTDGGTSWSQKRLTWNSSDSEKTAIAVDSNNHIHVVWQNEPTVVDYEIYYKRSTDGGTSWSSKRLTWNSAPSQYPSIAVGPNNNIHVVWEDPGPGNWEIFYKKGIQ